MWPFVLPPAPPPRKRKRIEPGFTPEELEYLEQTLAIIDGMSSSDVSSDNGDSTSPHTHTKHHSSKHIVPIIPSFLTNNKTFQTLLGKARLWALTHPATLGVLLIFAATLLLARTPRLFSFQTFLGAMLVVIGLRILSAAETFNGFDPLMEEEAEEERPTARSRHRKVRRSSRRNTNATRTVVVGDE